NLALEYFAESDVVAAREMLMSCYMEHLFRVGFSVTLQLQRRAGQIASCPIAPYLDGPFRALVEALRRRKPCFFRGIESADQGGERPFATLREVRMTEQWLDRLDVQRQLFIEAFPFAPASPESFELEGCIPDTGADLALSDVFLTALANRILGRTFDPVPIPSEELVALHGRISVDGHLDADLRRETVAWLDSLVAGAGVFGDYCLDVWEEEFCAIPPDELDPRYLGGLIVRLT
ncbi:MAG TPA: DUF6178 family protein, partial [Desulfuromonadales bacterium]|nr:DUF6178 family protein [Desulfuromonadales bacterium]